MAEQVIRGGGVGRQSTEVHNLAWSLEVPRGINAGWIRGGTGQGPGKRALTRTFVVGTAGLEPATSASRTLRATKLRYVPIEEDVRANAGDHTMGFRHRGPGGWGAVPLGLHST